jgi:TetR/AcrR family transcriptional regulator
MAAGPLGETGISDQMVKQDVKHNRKSLQALSSVSFEVIAATRTGCVKATKRHALKKCVDGMAESGGAGAGMVEANNALPAREAGNSNKTRKASRIQIRNQERILDGALSVFAKSGFRGATVDELARAAGMTKPNLLYYFRSKKTLYVAVLEFVLERWLEPLEQLDPEGEPAEQILQYMRAKLAMSKERPEDSRLFANEILNGAPMLGIVLQGHLKELVEEKAIVIRNWCDTGQLNKVDPYHLIFFLWATTQHYADFEAQVTALLGGKSRDKIYSDAADTLETLLMQGLLPGN